jgi:hypothetical protein
MKCIAFLKHQKACKTIDILCNGYKASVFFLFVFFIRMLLYHNYYYFYFCV